MLQTVGRVAPGDKGVNYNAVSTPVVQNVSPLLTLTLQRDIRSMVQRAEEEEREFEQLLESLKDQQQGNKQRNKNRKRTADMIKLETWSVIKQKLDTMQTLAASMNISGKEHITLLSDIVTSDLGGGGLAQQSNIFDAGTSTSREILTQAARIKGTFTLADMDTKAGDEDTCDCYARAVKTSMLQVRQNTTRSRRC